MKFFEEYDVELLSNYIAAKRMTPQEKSIGGLYLAPSGQQASLQATVLAVGPGIHRDGTFVETKVKVGDTVLIDRIAGIELEVSGEKLLVLRETEVIGIIRNK